MAIKWVYEVIMHMDNGWERLASRHKKLSAAQNQAKALSMKRLNHKNQRKKQQYQCFIEKVIVP